MAKQIDVVAAVILRRDRVLCAQRGPGGHLAGLWEFPGGKIEGGERPRAALAREIVEELRCQVAVGDEVTTTTYEYEFGTVALTTFYCELVSGEPDPTEHAQVQWLAPEEMDSLTWAPADVPAIRLIQDRFA